jgi:hypothetical protein
VDSSYKKRSCIEKESNMIQKLILALVAGTCLMSMSAGANANPRPVVWADCVKYNAVVAPNQLPMKGNFDQLYMMPDFAFADGIPLISESKPGDRDYNGGRWHVNVLKEGVDPSKYAGACSEEDLDLGDFEGTGVLFSCPLLPNAN